MTNTSTAGCERIAFYTIGNSLTPSSRFRVLQYLPAVSHLGWEVRLFSLPSLRGGRLIQALNLSLQGVVRFSQLSKAENFDLIFVQKGITPWKCRGMLEKLRSARRPFILDLDDAIYLNQDRYNLRLPGVFAKLQNDSEPVQLVQEASHVIAGNQFLADFADQYHKRWTLIPTSLDTERFSPGPPNRFKTPVIGWSGTTATNFYVNRLSPVLNELATKHDFEFHFISDRLDHFQPGALKKVNFKFVRWSQPNEIDTLRQIQIGVMPLEEDDWAKGKCGFKALQYMSVGVPAVCSPVGVSLEIIQDGVNGFLARTPDEWSEKLTLLIKDPALRAKMGLEARKTVMEKYSLKVNTPKFIGVIERVLEEGRKSDED